MITIAFFNNKGGVGKTTLLYHVAWMFADLGVESVCIDLDPQSNLTSMCLPDAELQRIWPDRGTRASIFGMLEPLVRGKGDLLSPPIIAVKRRLSLLPGDLALSQIEDRMSIDWMQASSGNESALRFSASFSRAITMAGAASGAQLAFIDLGPNLGSITRAALIAADFVVVPLAPDLFSIQALRNLGPRITAWRTEWADRVGKRPSDLDFSLPNGDMRPAGYVVMQFGLRDGNPVKAYERFLARIPAEFHEHVVMDSFDKTVAEDPYHLASLKHYRSLAPLAMQARKPMFELKASDGVIGAHTDAVRACRRDFEKLALGIASRVNLQPPEIR